MFERLAESAEANSPVMLALQLWLSSSDVLLLEVPVLTKSSQLREHESDPMSSSGQALTLAAPVLDVLVCSSPLADVKTDAREESSTSVSTSLTLTMSSLQDAVGKHDAADK